MIDPTDHSLAESWMRGLRDPGVAAALESVYAAAARAITARGPACWASGRCCNFDRAGHRLYVTGLEAAYCLDRLGVPQGPSRDGPAVGLTVRGLALDQAVGGPPPGQRWIADLDAAAARGGCPFQVRNLCGVHDTKPLGCRVYFCDRSAQAWQQDLSEELLAQIRVIHDQFGLAYRYGEWRGMLAMFRV